MKTNIIKVIFLLTYVSNLHAFEVYSNYPGGRASGMAGVFMAQADDSSGLWYNPAGMSMLDGVDQDYTIEWGQINQRILSASENNTFVESTAESNTIKYIAAYSNRINYFQSDRIGLGIAYRQVNDITLMIDAPQSAFNNNTFGRITQVTHQLSPGISYKALDQLSIGTTLDVAWSSIECLDYSACVENAAYGFGTSVGVLYQIANFNGNTINFGAVWRPHVELGYKSRNQHGIGSIIEEYLVDLPAMRSMGISYQIPTEFGLVNANMEFGKTKWSDTLATSDTMEFSNQGISIELLVNSKWLKNTALRGGWRESTPDSSDNIYGMRIASVGLGYSPGGNQFFDISFENRTGDIFQSGKNRTVSLSYSYQK